MDDARSADLDRVRLGTSLAGGVLVFVGGCDPADPIVELFDSSGEFSAVVLPRPATTAQLGRNELGRVAGDVDGIEYRVPTSARIYLLRGDVNKGLDAQGTRIPYLRMPTSTGPGALYGFGFTDKDWSSVRVEDLGRCSLFFSWQALGLAFNAGLEQALIESGDFGRTATVRGTGSRNLGPILRRAGTYEAIDEIRYNGTFEASSAGGCAPIVVDFETRFELTPSGSLRNLAADARVQGFCIAAGAIEAGVTDALRTELSAAFGSVVQLITRFDPGDVGLTQQFCSGDPDDPVCPSPLRGSESTCGGGSLSNVCDVRVDLDRAFVVPEGIELVYAQTASDPQISIIDDALGDEIFARLGVDRAGAAGLELAHFGCEPNLERVPSTPATDSEPDDEMLPSVVDPIP